MMNFFIWPLAGFFLIIFIILYRKNSHKLLKPKRWKYIFAGYLGLLLIFTIVYFIVQPQQQFYETVSAQPPSLAEIVYQDTALDLLQPYERNEWTFELTERSLKLKVEYNGRMIEPLIPVKVIEDESRQSIQVVHYETPSLIEQYNVSEYITLPTVEVVDEEVIVNFTNVEHEYEFYAIENVLTLNQFTDISRNNIFYDIHVGEIALVITVPKGTAINSDIRHFHIVK